MSETGHTHLRYYVNVCTCGNNDTGDLNALSFFAYEDYSSACPAQVNTKTC